MGIHMNPRFVLSLSLILSWNLALFQKLIEVFTFNAVGVAHAVRR